MTKVRIYDSEGYLRFGQPDDDEHSEFIREAYSTSQLRLYVDTRTKPYRAVCYFRAIESAGQRSEQFYGEIEFDGGVQNLLPELKRQVETKAREIFHEVDISNPTTDAFEHLDVTLDVARYMDADDVDAGRELVSQGEQLTFGAGDQLSALALVKQLLMEGGEYVVADSGRTQQFGGAELVLDTGFEGSGLAPAKETSRKLDKVKHSEEKDTVDEQIEAIEGQLAALKEMKQRKGFGSSQVEKKLTLALERHFPSLLEGTTKTKDTKDSASSKRVEVKPKDQTSTLDKLTSSKLAVVGIVAIAFLLVGAVVLAQTGGLGFLDGLGTERGVSTGNFSVEILNESDLSSSPGEDNEISARVSNIADEDGAQNVELVLDGGEGASKNVDLEGGGETVVNLTWRVNEIEEDYVQDFEATVSTLNDSDTISVGVGQSHFDVNITNPSPDKNHSVDEPIEFNANITNRGIAGATNPSLKIYHTDESGEEVFSDTRSEYIEREDWEEVSFVDWNPESTGDFTGNISTNNNFDTVNITVTDE